MLSFILWTSSSVPQFLYSRSMSILSKSNMTRSPVLMYSMTWDTPSMSWSSMGGTQGLLSSLRMDLELRKSRLPREGGSTVSLLPCRCSSRSRPSSPISWTWAVGNKMRQEITRAVFKRCLILCFWWRQQTCGGQESHFQVETILLQRSFKD